MTPTPIVPVAAIARALVERGAGAALRMVAAWPPYHRPAIWTLACRLAGLSGPIPVRWTAIPIEVSPEPSEAA